MVEYRSLYSCTTAAGNVALGYQALYNDTTGGYNTAVGLGVLYNTTTGGRNTAVSQMAENVNTSGQYNTYLGYGVTSDGASYSNSMALGNGASVNASNKVVIGNSSVSTIGGYAGWTNYSDLRLKENITDYSVGLDFIRKLRPINFNLKVGTNKEMQQGLIAQEVKAVMDELDVNFSGYYAPTDKEAKGMRMLAYSKFVLPLINSVKEQQEQIEELRAEIDKLKEELSDLK